MPTNLIDNQLYEEYNQLSSFELCFLSQELIQDLIHKASDFVVQLRPLSYNLLTSDQSSYLLRKAKVEDHLKTFESIFLRLRTLGSIISKRKLVLDQESELNNAESATSEASSLVQLQKEKDELIEQLRTKNQYIKLAIDKTSDIIWQINSIQTLKH